MATKQKRYNKSSHAAVTTTPSERPEQGLKRDIHTATEALLEELKVGKSERLIALLQFGSRFHQYSFGNTILILLQRPDATHVAGYRTWEKMGYHVAKGQHGIRILAPRTFKRSEQNDAGESEEQSKLYFASVAVFDASQLNPEELAERPLPSFYHSLGSDEETEALCAKVIERMGAQGIRVEEQELEGTKQGYSQGGLVVTRTGLPSRNRIRTLVHEWAHELLHQATGAQVGVEREEVSKEAREWQAEATSYVVLAHYGLHNEFASDYVQMWGATPEALMVHLNAIQKAANAIITVLEGKPASDEAAA